MANDVVVVLDCGATNVRAIAVDAKERSSPRACCRMRRSQRPRTAPGTSGHSMKSSASSHSAARRSRVDWRPQGIVVGVTVTTFGVDGAPVDARAPCSTRSSAPEVSAHGRGHGEHRQVLRSRTSATDFGRRAFTFNTLYKFIWLRENRPDILDKTAHWLFISSLINHRLTGVFSTDRTMAGTSQMFDLAKDEFSEEILRKVGIAKSLFPKIVNPGEVIGQLHADAAQLLGLPVGIPVTSAGHDTQFALFGSGAGMNQPVLSSGTWEILMARTAQVDTASLSGFAESTCELDSASGLYNPGLQWLASGVLEWVKETCWKAPIRARYLAQMIAEANAVAPGCDGVKMRCGRLLVGGGGVGGGAFSGLSINTSRGHLYRATLEALSAKLAHQLHELERICGFTARS